MSTEVASKSLADVNREILAVQERLDHVAAKARVVDDVVDMSDVTVYGDVSNEAKGERFRQDQQLFRDLLAKQQTLTALVDAQGWRQLTREAKELVGSSAPVSGDIASRLAVAVKASIVGGTQTVPVSALEMKALMTSTGGFPPEVLRSGRVELTPLRPTLVLDLPPMVRTNQNAYKFMRETTLTNTAAEIAEGTAYPEAALAYQEEAVSVQKLAVHLPVTEEQLEDETGIEDLVRARLSEMIRQRLDNQILNGNGTAPNLRGLRNVSGINAVARGTDTVLDAIYKGIVACRTIGFAQPNAIIINPTDLQAVRLAKTTDGQYLFGPPSTTLNTPIWGLPVVETTAVPAGKVIVGDWATYSALVMRSNLDIQTGYSGTGFIQGIRTIRLDLRTAFVVFRPSAFAEITL